MFGHKGKLIWFGIPPSSLQTHTTRVSRAEEGCTHQNNYAHDASSHSQGRDRDARPATWTPDNEPDKNAGRGLRRPSVPAVRAKLEGHTAVHRARRRSGIGGSVRPGTVVAPRVARRVGGEPAWTGGISAAVRVGESLSWNGCDAMR